MLNQVRSNERSISQVWALSLTWSTRNLDPKSNDFSIIDCVFDLRLQTASSNERSMGRSVILKVYALHKMSD